MCDFNFQTFYFLGEFNSLRVGKRLPLFIDISYVQHLTHELNHRLRLVESRCRNCKFKSINSQQTQTLVKDITINV